MGKLKSSFLIASNFKQTIINYSNSQQFKMRVVVWMEHSVDSYVWYLSTKFKKGYDCTQRMSMYIYFKSLDP